jgi:hypothetical protein
MTESEIEALKYRFSGYQLPLIQLDETGPAYVQIGVHPYYKNQPLSWQTNAFKGNTLGTTEIVGGSASNSTNNTGSGSSEANGGLIDLIDF